MADKVFGPHTASQEVYEVAAKPVVKAAMEGVNGKFELHFDFQSCQMEGFFVKRSIAVAMMICLSCGVKLCYWLIGLCLLECRNCLCIWCYE